MRSSVAVCVLGVLLFAFPAPAQVRPEYRAFWVDTFNTTLNTHNDVLKVVNNAQAANANAIFAQVRRRGDAWYLNSLEPPPDPSFIAAGFDPLRDLIIETHARGMELHAYVIICAVWNKDPTATGGLPSNHNHVFYLHGGYDPGTKQIIDGPDNWLTKTRLADSGTNIRNQGHRFGNEFYIDLGHPAAAQYTLDVLMNLVRNYDIDGLHLDRIRYPEFSASGQTPTNGTNIGYNPASVDRFNQHVGNPAGTIPATGDAAWMQWRRDQVTSFVRRLYLNVIAVNPRVKLSGSFIAFGDGPTTEAGWLSAEAYWRVYQDWRAWTEEGITDLAMPMDYKREHGTTGNPPEPVQFDHWSEWLKNHQYNRAGLVGIGAYLNGIEGTLRQTRRALQPSSTGKSAAGVAFYSFANPDAPFAPAPLTSAQKNVGYQEGLNPFSLDYPAYTVKRGIIEFGYAVTTSKSQDTLTTYETAAPPIFANSAPVPTFSWKAAPTLGHLMGVARRGDNSAVDTGAVTLVNVDANTTRSAATDGNGFFGSVDLAPARYHAKVQLGTEAFYSCYATVIAGQVTNADALVTHPPTLSAPADKSATTELGSCAAHIDVGTPTIANTCGNIPAATFVRSDHAADLSTSFAKGTTTITWSLRTADGPVNAVQTITVIDAEPPQIANLSVDKPSLWPANHKMVRVNVPYDATDNCSGVVSTSLSVASSEPVDGTGDGDQSPDWEVADAHTVRLRAERAGTGTDRVYTITVTATDSSQNVSTANVNVVVPHDQAN